MSGVRASSGIGRLDSEVELGYVSGMFGIRGEVRLHLHHRESTLLSDGQDVVLIDAHGVRREVFVSTRSGAGRRVLGRVSGVSTREGAASLMGYRLVVSRTALPALDSDEFYYGDLEGLEVVVDGERVGQVVKVHDGGGAEVLEIELSGGARSFVPCVQAQVLDIDVSGGQVLLAAGILD